MDFSGRGRGKEEAVDDANELRRILRQAISQMLLTQQDGYGQILRILSDVSANPEIEELANRAYQDELAEALADSKPPSIIH
jgi:hypothetical protein